MEPIVFLNLELTEAGLSERDGLERPVFVPAREVQRVEPGHGFVAERMIPQLLFGAAIVAGGLVLVRPVLEFLLGRRALIAGRIVLLGPALIAFGAWVLVSALRRGPYLRVVTASGPRKLRLRGTPADAELAAFIARVHAALGRA